LLDFGVARGRSKAIVNGEKGGNEDGRVEIEWGEEV
jgi:hypothetical protein